MNNYVADTMAFILYLEKRKMPKKVKQIFKEAELGKHNIYIPTIVITEIAYLSEKNRIDINLQEVKQHIKNSQFFNEQALNLEIVENSFEITDINELHDRLIAGTSKYLNFKLLTNDPIIEKSKFVKTIWK